MKEIIIYEAGDIAIAEVAKELLASAPHGSRIVRTGGDEFLIFAALDKDSTEPDHMGPKFDKAIGEYNAAHPEHLYEVGASYGWVLEPVANGMTNLDEYTRIADEKMYQMKKERDKYRRD